VLLTGAVEVDFGGETAPRAGHQGLQYMRRSAPLDSMNALCSAQHSPGSLVNGGKPLDSAVRRGGRE